MSRERTRRLELWGWILFVVSALLFIASSLRSGDVLSLLGGLFFFAACVVFLVPFRKRRPATDGAVASRVRPGPPSSGELLTGRKPPI
ncbi:MAG: hypothetical protein ACE5H8_11095 [Alphaproteobacteria bacterium]